ncbi:MAG: PKD domain-containing protein [Thermoplasmata archaeon]|nr:PKD domain-containing protein [Thermoplasmata archaeon]
MRVHKAYVAIVAVLMIATVAPGCINDPENAPPRAIFESTVSSVNVGDVVSFDATNSSDKDGSITSFHWDFGDNAETMGQTAIHVYDSFGIFNVTLTVTDDLGKKSIFVQTIIVNALPRAVIGANPEVQFINEAIAFSGEGSTDADGNIASFLWDFGDGNGSTQPNPQYTYEQVGSYMVTLTITDNRGAQSVDTRFVRIKFRSYDVNFTLVGANSDNQRQFTAVGTTSVFNITIDVDNLNMVRFRLSWKDRDKPIGGDPNDIFRMTVTPPNGDAFSANGTSENLTLMFPLASVPLNRTMDGSSSISVYLEVMDTMGSELGMGVWLVSIEAVECGGFRDEENTWINDPGNFWDLAVHYESFDVDVTES